jgi:hypothetical protein
MQKEMKKIRGRASNRGDISCGIGGVGDRDRGGAAASRSSVLTPVSCPIAEAAAIMTRLTISA